MNPEQKIQYLLNCELQNGNSFLTRNQLLGYLRLCINPNVNQLKVDALMQFMYSWLEWMQLNTQDFQIIQQPPPIKTNQDGTLLKWIKDNQTIMIRINPRPTAPVISFKYYPLPNNNVFAWFSKDGKPNLHLIFKTQKAANTLEYLNRNNIQYFHHLHNRVGVKPQERIIIEFPYNFEFYYDILMRLKEDGEN